MTRKQKASVENGMQDGRKLERDSTFEMTGKGWRRTAEEETHRIKVNLKQDNEKKVSRR